MPSVTSENHSNINVENSCAAKNLYGNRDTYFYNSTNSILNRNL